MMGVGHSTALAYIHNLHFGTHFESSYQHYSVRVAVLILVLGFASRDSVVRGLRRTREMSLDL